MDSIAVSTIDCTRVAEKSISLLNLSHAQLGDEYGYHSLSLCVIDAVFSIGVRYGGVQTVVQNYCSHFSQSRLRSEPSHWPTTEEQIPLSVLCQQFEELGVQHMAEVVFNCCIPDDCIDSKRYPLFMARAVLQELIESLQSSQEVKPC